jgi:hypothetical protein
MIAGAKVLCRVLLGYVLVVQDNAGTAVLVSAFRLDLFLCQVMCLAVILQQMLVGSRLVL